MKNSIFYIWLVLIISFCYLQSCTNDKGELPTPIKTVSYQSTIKPIIITNCYGQNAQTCHVTPSNQGSNGDFTTYTGLKQKIDNGSFQIRVLSNTGSMPPSFSTGPKSLSSEDLEKLKTWVNDGAQNN